MSKMSEIREQEIRPSRLLAAVPVRGTSNRAREKWHQQQKTYRWAFETKAPEYPEHDKLMKITGHSQAIGEFLDYMSDRGYTLRKWSDDEYTYLAHPGSIYSILADYFDINQAKLEREKRQMLAVMRGER
jgi:hypothetical protein